MKTIHVSTAVEYVAAISELEYLDTYWFRGVSSIKHTTIPGLVWRNAKRLESYLEHSFLVSYKKYTNNSKLNLWEIYALMQHHGLPTRQLDWSESALVALYFALSSDLDSNDNCIVYAIDPHDPNNRTLSTKSIYCPSEILGRIIENGIDFDTYLPPNLSSSIELELPKKPIAINASQQINRVSSQKGCFTIHGASNTSIIDYMADTNRTLIIQFEIKNKLSKINSLNLLSKLGVDEEFIYQDLDSLCTRIKRESKIDL